MISARRIHLIGIGGSGMSSIASILMDMGCEISGSDIRATPVTRRLEQRGASVLIGHSEENVDGAEMVVVSAAIPGSNVEMRSALSRRIPVVQRAELLGELMEEKNGIAITGAHGKTTTTAMVALLLKRAGLDPTILVGGEFDEIGGSGKLGRGEYVVAEADESAGQFLELSPQVAVVTNIDDDHLDYYGSLESIVESFRVFLRRVKPGGVAVLCADDPNLRRLSREVTTRRVLYGLGEGASVTARDPALDGFNSRFTLLREGRPCGRIELRVPGEHNVCNALAACAVGFELGIDISTTGDALSSFRGVHRRLEVLYSEDGVMIVDDYAHHPTEIVSTLAAAREFWRGRIICVFQPHRYTRTALLERQFQTCFDAADLVVLDDIYPAGEDAIKGVSSERVVEGAGERSVAEMLYIPGHDSLVDFLEGEVRPQDLVMTIGAGNIRAVGEALRERLSGERVSRSVG